MADLDLSNREEYADWIETTVLARGSHLGLDLIIASGADDCGLGEAQVSLGLKTMRQRESWLGESYPFHVGDVAVQPRPGAENSVYACLLMLSPNSPARQLMFRSPTNEMAVTFEKLVAAASKKLLGDGSSAVRFGWPSDEGRPQNFHSAIEWLAQKMGISAGSAFRPPLRKDGGVDVVAWRPFPDAKSGFPVVLVQCTLQSDFVPKARDIDVRNWSGWLTLDIDPLTVLAIPGTIAKREDWDEIALRSLILDRVRIAGLLTPVSIDDAFDFGVVALHMLPQLRKLLSGAE